MTAGAGAATVPNMSIQHASIRVDAVQQQRRRIPVRLRIAQALLLLTGVFGMAGAAYFGIVEPDDRYAYWVTALVAPVAFAIAAARVVAAVRLNAGPTPRTRRFVLAVVGAAIAFTTMKVAVFSETEAISFGVVDLAVLALVVRR